MVFGLALVLALVLGIATMALAAVPGDPFKLGQVNRIDKLTTLIGNTSGAMLAVDNDSTAKGARALDLSVDDGNAPMRVNSDAKVAKLNADKVDGMEAATLAEPRGYAHVEIDGDTDALYPFKGVNDVELATRTTNTYCFDLTFTPKAAVGSPHLNNNAVVATATPPNSALNTCPPTHRDAAARTFAADTGENAAINFQIVFE